MLCHSDVALPAHWLWLARGYATVSRLSVRLSVRVGHVCFSHVAIIRNQIAQISPNSGDLDLWEHTQNMVEWGGVMSAKKPAISVKWWNIGPRLLWRTNRKSYTRFQLLSKSMTLDDLEQPKRHSCRNKKSFTEPTRKKWTKIDTYYQRQCRPMILVSMNIRYMRIFAGVLRGGGIKYNKCYT